MFKNLTIIAIGDLISKIFSVILTVILIRKLSIISYSYYIAFMGVMSLLPGIVGTGLNQAMVVYGASFISQYKQKPVGLYIGNILIQSVIYSSLLIILGIFIPNQVVLFLFGKKEFKNAFLYALIGGFGLLLTQSGRSIFQTEENFRLFSFTLLTRQLFLLISVSVLLFVFKLKDVKYVLLLISGISLFFGILLFGYAIFPYIPKIFFYLREQKNVFLDFLKNSYWLIGYWLTLNAFNRLDIFMLSHLSTKKELAYYGVAYQYYNMGVLFLGSIHTVLLPTFSKRVVDNKIFLKKWIKISLIFILPIFLIIALIGKPIFLFINGYKYKKSFYIFYIFLIGLGISFVFSPLINIIMSMKQFKVLFILAVIAFLINFLGNYTFIPIYGSFAAAFFTILSIATINVLAVLQWIR